MKISKPSLSISLLLVVLFTWAGCVSDLAEYDENITTNGSNTVTPAYLTLSISMPSTKTRDSSAADNTLEDQEDQESDPETYLKEIDVLVFEEKDHKEYLSYITQAHKINNYSTGLKSFEAKLKQSKNDEKYRVVVIANAHDAVIQAQQQLEEDVEITKQDFLSTVQFKQTAAWDTAESGLPLWGETTSTHHIFQNTQGGELGVIHMLRAMARIDVVSSLTPDKFKLTEVVVCNVRKKSLVAPRFVYNEELSAFEQLKPSLANTKGTDINDDVIEKIRYSVSDESNSINNEIYVGEAKNEGQDKLEKLCLLIGGKYNGSETVTWYRVDFDSDKSPNGVNNILRNHLYNMNITAVSKPGVEDEDAAFATINTDMTVSINAWDLYELGDILFDGQYFLSINPSEIEHDREAVTKDTIFISTNVFKNSNELPTYKVYDALNKHEITLPLLLWIKDIEIIQLNSENVKDSYALVYSLKENNHIRKRELYLRISASDNLTVALKVSQTSTVLPEIRIEESTDDGYKETDAIYFVDEYGASVHKKLRIKYKPSDATLKVVSVKQDKPIRWIDGYEPPVGVWSDSNGRITKDIMPGEITYGTAKSGDFDEHMYKIVAILESDNETISKSLTFVQAKPGIFLEAPKMLMLDGKETYEVKVKSSIPWSLDAIKNTTTEVYDIGSTGVVAMANNKYVRWVPEGNTANIVNLVKDKTPSLHFDEIIPIETVNDLKENAYGHMHMGYFGLKASSSFYNECTAEAEILCTTAINQMNREANCYVIPANPSPDLEAASLMIPIRLDQKDMVDKKLGTAFEAPESLPTITNAMLSELQPKLIWQDSPPQLRIEHEITDFSTRTYSNKNLISALSIYIDPDDKQPYLMVFRGTADLHGNFGSKLISKGGNALVAVTDKEGNILRSWHIWITDMSFEGDIFNGILQTGAEGTSKWLARDLGALSSEPKSSDVYGYLYQWGRKEPFPAWSGLGNSDKIVYEIEEKYDKIFKLLSYTYKPYELVEEVSTEGRPKKRTSTQALQNPTVIYTVGHWNKINNLWSNSSTGKSIFDPCPAGYHIPTQGNFTDLVKIGSWVNAIANLPGTGGVLDQDGLYWPSGKIRGDGNKAQFIPGLFRWSATLYKSPLALNNKFYALYIAHNHKDKTTSEKYGFNAMPIRCIKIGSE